MDFPTFDQQFNSLKFNLWIVGIPYGDFKIRLRYFTFVICVLIMIIIESSFLISKIKVVNFLEITQLLPCTFIGILSNIKILAVMLKRRKIFYLTESLSHLYKDIETDQAKRDLVRSEVMFLKKLSKYFFTLNYVLISIYLITPPVLMLIFYIKNKKLDFILPFDVLLPFEVDSWVSWGAVYIFSIVCGVVVVIFFITTDIFYCALTTHVCINFTIISDKIKYLKPSDFDELKQIVKDHQYVLQLSEDLEDIFTVPNLFNVLIRSVEICALGFNLTMGELKQVPGCLLFLVSVLLQILMMSSFGENLLRESSAIGQAAYACDWYKMDIKLRKIILLLITRANRPQKLTAYKFSVISYQIFSKIISTSWSYFTILRTVYTPPEGSSK